MPSSRSTRRREDLEAVAGNGLLHRRAFLRGGAAFAAAITGYTLSESGRRPAARRRSVERGSAAVCSPTTACRRGSRNRSRAR